MYLILWQKFGVAFSVSHMILSMCGEIQSTMMSCP